MKKPSDTMIAVAKIGDLVTRTLDTGEILDQVVAITRNIMKVDACSIYLFNREENALFLKATIGLKGEAVGQVRIDSGEGITGRVAKGGRILSVADVAGDKRNKYFPITGEEQFRSLLSVPLRFQEELIGVINVQTRDPRTYTPHERRLLKTIAQQVSGSIRNARLYESVLVAKRELETTQEKLVQSEKMAALGRLALTLSHELRNPLAGLKGASQLLMRKTDERDDRRQYVTLIIDEVERLGRIVDDLLHFARPRELRYEPIDANRIIDDILLLHSQDLTHRSITVHKRLSKLPMIMADTDKFKQVVVNILLNSMDAMPDGGELIVSSGVVRNDPDTLDMAAFQFRDTGSGIPDDVMSHMFEPFYTTKPSGVGLGLSVCRAIIQEHAGRLLITTNQQPSVPQGTLVTFEIPINEAQKH